VLRVEIIVNNIEELRCGKRLEMSLPKSKERGTAMTPSNIARQAVR
jgi:hypothetical protein